MRTFPFQRFYKFLLPVFTALLFLSCQKDLTDNTVNINPNQNPDLATRVNSTVSGFVTDENGMAVLGANVQAGTATVTTDKYGYFILKNTSVVQTAAVVTVSRSGYFNGIKTYFAETGKQAFFRIKLIPKTNRGTINATTGGNVTLSSGLIIAISSNAVVNATTNAAYTGIVNVAVEWINPTATDLNQTMPGDLRGIATDGSLKTLTTYGMAAVELTGASGELLQIAPGKKATLTMPVPTAILASAPNTIPLWFFDEAKGLWKEEGQATKTGTNYVGEVSHFSFWNCDVPANYIQFNCTLKDAAGNPLPFTPVKLSVTGNSNNARFGYTDSSGYVSGLVPANTQLLMEVFANINCGAPVYTQTYTTTSTSLSLGVITIPPSTLNVASISGTATDCMSNPVTNGYIIMFKDNQYFRHAISNTGSFNFTTILCSNNANASFIAEDITAAQQSSSVSHTLVSGANALGNIQACGITTQEFVTYTVNGGAAINYSSPFDSLYQTGQGTSSIYYFEAWNMTNNSVAFSMTTGGIAAGSTQNLSNFQSPQTGLQSTLPSPVLVNITEYGNVGQFIAGNFSGSVRDSSPPNTVYNVVCSFRIRRSL